MKNDVPFEFFETTDPFLIADYIELRRRVFRLHYPWLSPSFGCLDDTDHASHIVIGRHNDAVAAGARLTVSNPRAHRRLPLEEAGFDLLTCDLLADSNLRQTSYAEIGRMAVDPSCANGLEVSCGLARELCRVAACLGVDVILSICPESAVRLNRRNAKTCGVGFRRLLELPTVFGVSMWLCVFDGIRKAWGISEVGEALRCNA